ncbi:MAG: methionyl-tRNA formyltransferase [Candidatus Brocadiales bacterium]
MNIVFMGTSDFAVPSLRSLASSNNGILAVVTQPDRPKGRSGHPCAPPVKVVAGEHGLRVIQSENVNHPETILLLKELCPDIIVVVAYGQKLSQQILSIPKYKCINIHASLLPKYRGAAPVNWVIINGEEATGISVMLMEERMDTGDIIAQRSLQIHPHETAGELEGRLALLGAEALLSVLEQFENGTVTSRAQNDADTTHARKLKKEDGRIDWNQEAKNIYNLVRGMTPRPGAYSFLYLSHANKKTRVIILKTEIGESTLGGLDVKPTPGSIIDISDKGINVAAIDSNIWITVLQPEGKRAMNAAGFTRGHNVKIGNRFNASDADFVPVL